MSENAEPCTLMSVHVGHHRIEYQDHESLEAASSAAKIELQKIATDKIARLVSVVTDDSAFHYLLHGDDGLIRIRKLHDGGDSVDVQEKDGAEWVPYEELLRR